MGVIELILFFISSVFFLILGILVGSALNKDELFSNTKQLKDRFIKPNETKAGGIKKLPPKERLLKVDDNSKLKETEDAMEEIFDKLASQTDD